MKKFIIVIVFSLPSWLHPINTKPVMHNYTALCKHRFIPGNEGNRIIEFKALDSSVETCQKVCKKKQSSLICLSVMPGHDFHNVEAYKAAQDLLKAALPVTELEQSDLEELEQFIEIQDQEDPGSLDSLQALLEDVYK